MYIPSCISINSNDLQNCILNDALNCFTALAKLILSQKLSKFRLYRNHLEPVIEHLVKGSSHSWEHRWKQSTCVTGRGGPWIHFSLTLFRGWCLQGKHLYLKILFFRVFGELWSLERSEQFFLYYWIVTAAFLGWSKTILEHLFCCYLSLRKGKYMN